MLTAGEALQEVERRLAKVQGMASASGAWEKYRVTELPANLDPKVEAKMTQSFHAGYDAATAAARHALYEAQNVALAAERQERVNA